MLAGPSRSPLGVKTTVQLVPPSLLASWPKLPPLLSTRSSAVSPVTALLNNRFSVAVCPTSSGRVAVVPSVSTVGAVVSTVTAPDSVAVRSTASVRRICTAPSA